MDQIPWIEKYRPTNFDEIILDDVNRNILKKMLEKNLIPNMIFYGPPGTGKTTTIINFINEFQKNNNQQHNELIIHLNASDDRGIDIIRNQIDSFTKASHLFNKGTKFIILDEIDYMTKNAQFLLYTLMKNNIQNVRFCLICNYISKLEKSLRNMCMAFKFNVLPKKHIVSFIKNICDEEKINNIGNSDIDNVIALFGSDIRSMINYLQRQYQTNNKKLFIISDDKIKQLLDCFVKSKMALSERKINNYMYNYNIEKQELIIYILKYITKHYKLTSKDIYFMKSILHNDNYYVDDFNKFFISNVVSLLR
jgi:DNA polymerase III delta prime subunit